MELQQLSESGNHVVPLTWATKPRLKASPLALMSKMTTGLLAMIWSGVKC